MPSPDTILATSSPPITSGTLRAILRLSGPNAWPLATSLTNPIENPQPGAHHIRLLDPDLPALLLLFKSPRSFTGEDIAELHLPASPALLHLLTHRLLQSGARPANPGEFSARAFFNAKIDLTEAEGIAATIAATNHTQLRAAASLREGHLHQDITLLTNSLAHLLALVEAGIDFTDEEDVSFIDTKTLTDGLSQLLASLSHRLAHALRIDHLTSPPTVAFIGLPNVGKSSLINALSETSRSIVSPIAGTTRDALSVLMPSPRGPIRLLDVPGTEELTDELREKMMATRTAAILDADLLITVIGPHENPNVALASTNDFTSNQLLVQNKIDLLPPTADITLPFLHSVSAKTGQNIPALRAAIINLVTRQESTSENRLVLNHRHRVLLFDTQSALIRASQLLTTSDHQSHPELLASELRTALNHLGSITGTISPDEVLGKIFSNFCIGK